MGSKQKSQNQVQPAGVKSQPKQKMSELETTPGFFQRMANYFQASQAELAKVSWPTWKEVKVTSYAVAGLVVVMSLFLGFADILLAWIVEAILSIGV